MATSGRLHTVDCAVKREIPDKVEIYFMIIDQSVASPLQPGDQLTVTIEALAAGGDGLARHEGFTIFVPGSAPGDIAEIALTQVAKNFGRARIVSLVQPGPARVPSPCPRAEICPGCQLQHLSYSAQLAAKTTFVRDGLERIGRLKGIEVRPTLGMEDPWHYRNKGEFIANIQHGRVELGYTGAGEQGFVPLPDCPIQHPLTMQIVRAVEDIATREQLPLAQLITRVSPDDGTALAILVCWDWHERLPSIAEALSKQVAGLVGILWSSVRGRSVVRKTLAEVLIGQKALQQRLGSRQYTVSAESFFQVNNVQATRLLMLADELAGDLTEAHFADAYCGVGTFLIPLAARALRAIGIEEHPIALLDAGANLLRSAIHDVKLYEGQVETMLSRLARKQRSIDVVVLDPPRKGAGRAVLSKLLELGVQRIVLISCDPATLGRDASDLTALGYQIQFVQPLDMFPQTWHVESIALVTRASADTRVATAVDSSHQPNAVGA